MLGMWSFPSIMFMTLLPAYITFRVAEERGLSRAFALTLGMIFSWPGLCFYTIYAYGGTGGGYAARSRKAKRLREAQERSSRRVNKDVARARRQADAAREAADIANADAAVARTMADELRQAKSALVAEHEVELARVRESLDAANKRAEESYRANWLDEGYTQAGSVLPDTMTLDLPRRRFDAGDTPRTIAAEGED